MRRGDDFDDLYLTTWMLDRLFNREYEFFLDGDGNVETLELGAEFGPRNRVSDPNVIEETLKGILPGKEWEALLSLKDHQTPEHIENVLTMILGPDVAKRGRHELCAASWSEILIFLDRAFLEPTRSWNESLIC